MECSRMGRRAGEGELAGGREEGAGEGCLGPSGKVPFQ